MKALLIVIVLSLACVSVYAEGPKAFSVYLKAATLKDAVDQISQKAGVTIVLDPKAQGTVTARLENAELPQALDAITRTNGLTWKKLQFARTEDSKVSLDQLRASILALATMPIIGLSVEDPAAKTSSVFARGLSAAPDVSSIKLPEGYTWSSAYVVLAPDAPAKTAGTSDERVKALSQDLTQRMAELSTMTPEDRKQVFAQEWVAQVSMTPEARQAMMRDRLDAVMSLDPQYRGIIREDWHQGFHMLRDQAVKNGDPDPFRRDGNR